MADDLGIMLTELPEATNIGDNDLMYIVQENNSEKVKVGALKDSFLGDAFGESSGNIVSFADGIEAGLAKCIAEIVPKQDLHGYDKPWAGGAGKNKAPFFTDITTGVVTMAVGNDGVCTLNGNSGSTSSLLVNNPITLEAGTYTLSDGVSEHKAQLQIYNMTTSSVYWIDTTQTFTYNGTDDIHIRLWIAGNASFSNYKIYPMVRISSTSADYEPYSNICPISGHSSVKINVSPTSDPSQGLNVIIQLGNTYYGGILNVLTGELTVTHAFVTIDGSETGVSWTDIGNNMRSSILNLYALKSAPESTGANAEAISNYLEKVVKNYSADVTGFYWYDEKQVYVKLNKASLPSADTAGCTTFLQNNNLQICYEIKNPLTYTLTPQEVNSLLGQNNISADTGDIDIVYVKESARIIPNPSGKSDAFLSSIELSGEKFEIIKELPAFPTSNGIYKLKLSVSSGVPTLSWVSDT